MIAIPAVDLREGACVQLVGGDVGHERIRRPDPVAVAVEWQAAGFAALHVVDLDAALGRGDNTAIVAELLASLSIPVQVGGGIRDDAAIDQMVSLGAARVVVGTRALTDAAWLERAATRVPGRIVVAADVRDRTVLTHGWTKPLGASFEAVLARLASLPLAAVLITAVHNEGRMTGPDLELTREVSERIPHPVQASGGIADLSDLRALSEANAASAVIGMALYTGAIDPREAAREFGGATS